MSIFNSLAAQSILNESGIVIFLSLLPRYCCPMPFSPASRIHGDIDDNRRLYYDVFCRPCYLGKTSSVSAAIFTKVQYFLDVWVTEEVTNTYFIGRHWQLLDRHRATAVSTRSNFGIGTSVDIHKRSVAENHFLGFPSWGRCTDQQQYIVSAWRSMTIPSLFWYLNDDLVSRDDLVNCEAILTERIELSNQSRSPFTAVSVLTGS